MSGSGIKSILIIFSVLAVNVHLPAYAKPVDPKKACPVVGLVPLKKYVSRTEWFCFKNGPSATSNGFTSYVAKRAARRAAKAPSVPCNAAGINKLGQYFKKNQTRCFSSAAAAKAAKYSKLKVTATPTPTATPTNVVVAAIPTNAPTGPIATISPTQAPQPTQASGTPTPTPTATPTLGMVNISYPNIPISESPSGTNIGSCSGQLQAYTLTLNCATNFNAATEAHLDSGGLPNDIDQQYCNTTNVVNGDFQIECQLTDRQRGYYVYQEQPNDIVPYVHLMDGAGNEAFGRIINE